MAIYFVSSGDMVKIGYTTGDPKERLRALQTGNALKLVLEAVKKEWGIAKERELHAMFSHLRRSGEWFSLAPDLKAFIKKINPNAFTRGQDKRNISSMRPTPNATEQGTEACRAFYEKVWDKKNSTAILKIIPGHSRGEDGINEFLGDAFLRQEELEEFIKENSWPGLAPWWISIDGKPYPENYSGTNWFADFFVNPLGKVHSIDTGKLLYDNSLEMYSKFKRYFNPRYYNDNTWKAYRQCAGDRGIEFVNQYQDAFWGFVDCVVSWAHIDNDQVVRLLSFKDEMRFYLAILPSPYRVKHIVEKSAGFYCHEDDALAGFALFCGEKSWEPVFDYTERIVSVKGYEK